MNKVYIAQGYHLDEGITLLKVYQEVDKALAYTKLCEEYDRKEPKISLPLDLDEMEGYFKSLEYQRYEYWANNHPTGKSDSFDYYSVQIMEVEQ